MSGILVLAQLQANRIRFKENTMTNQQAPEKRASATRGWLDVHSIFSTIQGEGPFCGHPAVFVRLAGCNLQCPGCDTEYTEGRKQMDYVQVYNKMLQSSLLDNSITKLMVVTGGEPFRQPEVVPFINWMIIQHGWKVQVETNGSMQIPLELNNDCVVVCSPKSSKLHPSAAQRANHFKYVLKAGNYLQEDGLPLQALDHRSSPYIARPPVNFRGNIYLQPMDEKDAEKNRANIRQVVENAKMHGYIVQLQVHKYLGVE